jgi:hypothetical protein
MRARRAPDQFKVHLEGGPVVPGRRGYGVSRTCRCECLLSVHVHAPLSIFTQELPTLSVITVQPFQRPHWKA